MKTERKLSVDLMAECRRQLRGSKVVKHSDRFTTGVPDITVSWLGITAWLEDKYLRKGEKLKDIIGSDQLVFCHELSTTTMGKCAIVIYEEHPKRTTIWIPRRLGMSLYPKLILQVIPENTPVSPYEVHRSFLCDVNLNLDRDLKAHGAITTEGWRHDFTARLVFDWAKHA